MQNHAILHIKEVVVRSGRRNGQSNVGELTSEAVVSWLRLWLMQENLGTDARTERDRTGGHNDIPDTSF